MNRLIHSLIGISILVTIVNAESKTIPSGWSLNGLGLNESAISSSSFSSDINTVWKYTENGWQAYSPNTTMQSKLSKAGISTLDSLEPGDGFWINAINETNLNSNTTDAKVLVSNYSIETDLNDTENKDYTYNYVEGSGVALAEYIDWGNASSLSEAPEDSSLFKTIPKVFSSSNKTHALVVNAAECTSDYTIAVTPYLSDASIPGTSQNHWNEVIAFDFDLYIPSSQTSTGLNAYSSGNTYSIETPIRELSVDISLSDSQGNRLSLEEGISACSPNAYFVYNFDDSSDISQNINDSNLSMYKVTGFNQFEKINDILTLSKNSLNKTITNDIISSFSPFIVTSKTTVNEFLVYDTSLSFTSSPFLMIRYPTLNSGISYSVNAISSSSLPNYSILSQKLSDNNMEIVKSFDVLFDGIEDKNIDSFIPTLYYYFINPDMKQYTLYGYNGSTYIPIIADQSTLDISTGKTVYHSGPYSSKYTKLVLVKPTSLDNNTFIGKWTQGSSSNCDANGGVLEITLNDNLVFATAVVGDYILAASGMPLSGNSFTGYTADGTAWQGTINGNKIEGQFSDYESCYGTFEVSR